MCGEERATAARGRRLMGAGIRARRSGQERAGSRVGRRQMTAVHSEGGGLRALGLARTVLPLCVPRGPVL